MTDSQSAPLLRWLRRGDIVPGTVTEIAPYGVTFVDVGGFTAHINIPELSWRPFDHPTDVVTVGQQITAEVLDVDMDRLRVALSLKALQPDPLLEFQQRIGEVITGPVTNVGPIGARIRVEDRPDGFEGLLRTSHLNGRTVDVGDQVTVRITQVDVTQRWIELALFH